MTKIDCTHEADEEAARRAMPVPFEHRVKRRLESLWITDPVHARRYQRVVDRCRDI